MHNRVADVTCFQNMTCGALQGKIRDGLAASERASSGHSYAISSSCTEVCVEARECKTKKHFAQIMHSKYMHGDSSMRS